MKRQKIIAAICIAILIAVLGTMVVFASESYVRTIVYTYYDDGHAVFRLHFKTKVRFNDWNWTQCVKSWQVKYQLEPGWWMTNATPPYCDPTVWTPDYVTGAGSWWVTYHGEEINFVACAQVMDMYQGQLIETGTCYD